MRKIIINGSLYVFLLSFTACVFAMDDQVKPQKAKFYLAVADAGTYKINMQKLGENGWIDSKKSQPSTLAQCHLSLSSNPTIQPYIEIQLTPKDELSDPIYIKALSDKQNSLLKDYKTANTDLYAMVNGNMHRVTSIQFLSEEITPEIDKKLIENEQSIKNKSLQISQAGYSKPMIAAFCIVIASVTISYLCAKYPNSCAYYTQSIPLINNIAQFILRHINNFGYTPR